MKEDLRGFYRKGVWLPNFRKWLAAQERGEIVEQLPDRLTAKFEFGDVNVTLRNIPVTPILIGATKERDIFLTFVLRYDEKVWDLNWNYVPLSRRCELNGIETSGALGGDVEALNELYKEAILPLLEIGEEGLTYREERRRK